MNAGHAAFKRHLRNARWAVGGVVHSIGYWIAGEW